MEEKKAEKIEKKTTSLKIDPLLWKDVKMYCLQNDIEIGYLVENMLYNYLTNKGFKVTRGSSPNGPDFIIHKKSKKS